MKAMAVIPLIAAGCVGAVASALKTAGLRIDLIEPMAAIVIASAGAACGLLPILRTRSTDAVTIVQLALVGTIIHLMATVVLAAILMFSHLVNLHGPFVFWLIGGYWVSLAALIWQLRRALLAFTSRMQN